MRAPQRQEMFDLHDQTSCLPNVPSGTNHAQLSGRGRLAPRVRVRPPPGWTQKGGIPPPDQGNPRWAFGRVRGRPCQLLPRGRHDFAFPRRSQQLRGTLLSRLREGGNHVQVQGRH